MLNRSRYRSSGRKPLSVQLEPERHSHLAKSGRSPPRHIRLCFPWVEPASALQLTGLRRVRLWLLFFSRRHCVAFIRLFKNCALALHILERRIDFILLVRIIGNPQRLGNFIQGRSFRLLSEDFQDSLFPLAPWCPDGVTSSTPAGFVGLCLHNYRRFSLRQDAL